MRQASQSNNDHAGIAFVLAKPGYRSGKHAVSGSYLSCLPAEILFVCKLLPSKCLRFLSLLTQMLSLWHIAGNVPRHLLQVLRTSQYGCNCRGMGGNGGCGEFDILEAIIGNQYSDMIFTQVCLLLP